MEIISVSIDHLVANPRNYKVHPPKQIAKIKASLLRFGQRKPIVVQSGPEHTLIIAGHGTVKAAQELEWTQIDAVEVPVTWTSTDATGYMVADNETANDAETDETLLAELLEEQKQAGHDLASLGSSNEELDDLLAKMTPPTLDELADTYGDEPDEETFWPVIKIKVSPETKERFDSIMGDATGESDDEKLLWVLERVNVALEDVS